ncbi:MAG: hypothetical protein M1825_006350 [Sarcosagium campestre]|nr:MAG: hypothetical protein M1825_006350 [Sarcosagium campestre]
MPTFGLILGSARVEANVNGLGAWLVGLIQQVTVGVAASGKLNDVAVVAPDDPIFPSAPVMEAVMPAQIHSSEDYSSPTTRAWSEFVRSCDSIIILTPQYNWGYPGGLKNALDHLYWEWRDKPVLMVLYGGHGGTKVAPQLAQVLQGGLKMRLTGQVGITLPKDYISGPLRVGRGVSDSATAADVQEAVPSDDFLTEYTGQVKEAISTLVAVLDEKSTS